MASNASAGVKRPRDDSAQPPPLDSTLERLARHLAQDPPGPKLDKAAEIFLKLVESSLSASTSGAFAVALTSSSGNATRALDARVASTLAPVFAAAEERADLFDASGAVAVRALALRHVHLRRIVSADEALDFNRRMRPLNEALQSLGAPAPSPVPAERVELFHAAIVDCLEALLELHERRSWAAPTVRAAFRVASERRLSLSEALRARLDQCSQLLHARRTAAGAAPTRTYAGGPAVGAGAGAMSGKHHPLVNVSGGGLASSARGAAVAAVPGVRELLLHQQQQRRPMGAGSGGAPSAAEAAALAFEGGTGAACADAAAAAAARGGAAQGESTADSSRGREEGKGPSDGASEGATGGSNGSAGADRLPTEPSAVART